MDHRPRVLLRSLVFVAFFASSASAQTAPVDDDPGHLVVLSEGWMPSVRLGYLVQVARIEIGDWRDHDVAHGFTSDVLVPLVATGERGSRTRLALALGMGVDLTGGDTGSIREPPSPPFGPTEPEPVTGQRDTVVYGQLGALLRRTGRHVDFVGSLVWQPGRWIVANLARLAAWERGRLSLGVLRGRWQLDVFVGLTALDSLTRVVDSGLRMGAGW